MSEGPRSKRASPTGTIGYVYRIGSRQSRIEVDPVIGPGTDVRDGVADGDRCRTGRFASTRERTLRRGPTGCSSDVHRRIHDGSAVSLSAYQMCSEADFDHVTEVIASDDA
ncbi:hypothetical protein QA600_20990 [Natronococcus sp. A-GB1]|uniref:hypothetical protein n=1 Tax=Natronococcus sp. A-GB1 TaxID=3037648 RepID=UPI00241F5642|nr:hypothetical protein [Natronococcus sp. A-GB1]MDG5761802.1 hypothetical protein [Natronococcus sp. A-GB1]